MLELTETSTHSRHEENLHVSRLLVKEDLCVCVCVCVCVHISKFVRVVRERGRT